MEEKAARIRIGIKNGEVEIEGSEAFIHEYMDKFEDLIEYFKTNPCVSTPAQKELIDQTPLATTPIENGLPEAFGEYLLTFKNSISDVDRILISGFFIQKRNTNNSFTTNEASQLLIEQGIKVKNPSASVTKNKDKQFVIKVGKAFRVSQKGISHIESLRGNQTNG